MIYENTGEINGQNLAKLREFIAVNYPKLHKIHDGWFLAFKYNPNRNMDAFQGLNLELLSQFIKTKQYQKSLQ